MAILLSDSYKVINWDLNTKALDTKYWGKVTDSGRGCKVALLQNGVLKTPSTETMRINFKKPSGLKVFIDGVISGNYFVFDFPNQVYTEVGEVQAELMLNVSSKFIMSSTFKIDVTQSMTDGIASTSEFDALTDALADIDEVKADIVVLENPTFTEASTLANINSGESGSTLWGKIKKMFSFIGTTTLTTTASTITTAINELVKIAIGTTLNYSASNTYALGAYTLYQGNLCRCITAITVGETFNATKWTSVSLVSDLLATRTASVKVIEYTITNQAVASGQNYLVQNLQTLLGTGQTIKGYTCTITDSTNTSYIKALLNFNNGIVVELSNADIISAKVYVYYV